MILIGLLTFGSFFTLCLRITHRFSISEAKSGELGGFWIHPDSPNNLSNKYIFDLLI